MPYKSIPYLQRFIGLTTDTKPSGALPGSILYEIDSAGGTAKKYITVDGENWSEITSDTEEE